MSNTVRHINQQFWSSKYIPMLSVRSTYNSVQNYKTHEHAELSIGLIKDGETCLSINNKHIILKKGDIIFIEPNKFHACNTITDAPRSYHMLYIDNTWVCEILSTLYRHKVTQVSCDRGQYSCGKGGYLISLIEAMIDNESSETAAKIEAEITHLIGHHCFPSAAFDSQKLANKVKKRLLENTVNPPSLNVMSLEFGRSKESIIRNFKRCFGITPKSFLNNYRVERAKILLRDGMNIMDVALEVGFSDQSQLHRSFVNYTASTPRQYQQITSIFDNNFESE
ncbi:AraC family transcriptional regulator [Psychromonas sp. PT13]|uniref:AraC family transcriptional regulator n=1 Tax=Psychromonas sp. PT13 TaxID=3439547 RepID=UPI003EB85B25